MTDRKGLEMRVCIAALAAVLPGDHNHYVSPMQRLSQSGADKMEQKDAAVAKRNRKNAKRKADHAR